MPVLDRDPQASAQRWTPVFIDTPASSDLPAPDDDSLPNVPLPGPMYPNTH